MVFRFGRTRFCHFVWFGCFGFHVADEGSALGCGHSGWGRLSDRRCRHAFRHPTTEIAMEPRNAWNSKKHCGRVVKMRILSASETLETQQTLWTRSENANFECQRNAWKAHFTIDSLRNCKFWVSASCLKSALYYRFAAKLQILSASQLLEKRTLL